MHRLAFTKAFVPNADASHALAGRLRWVLAVAALVLAPCVAHAASTNQLVFQDGTPVFSGGANYAGTGDTYLNGQDATTEGYNYGTTTTLQIRDRNADSDALIRFSQHGTGVLLADVTSATLTLTTSSTGSMGANENYDLFIVDTSDDEWPEGTDSAATPASGTGATYSREIYNTTSWAGGNSRTPVALTTSGAVGTQIASVDINGAVAGSTFSFTFSGATEMALIESWIASGANGGFVIVGRGRDAVGSDGPFWYVHSSEASTPTDRPKLTLNGDFQVVDTVVFSTSFDYASDPLLGSGDAATNLNGATGQIGTWGGTDPLPGTSSAGDWDPDIIGITNDFLYLDRPSANVTLSANFASSVALTGSAICSFDFSFRRTANDHTKDMDVAGFDSASNELFRIQLSAYNTAPEKFRIGAITNAGGATTWDLPGGGDADDYLNRGADTVQENIELTFAAASYTISYHGSGGEDFTTDPIAYTNALAELTRVDFLIRGTGTAATDGGVRLDNVFVASSDPQPVVDITNANASVASATYTIGGTNVYVVGTMTWTNALTGGSGTFAAPIPSTTPWSIPSISLAIGDNLITVSGTNASGTEASDSVTITRPDPTAIPVLLDFFEIDGAPATGPFGAGLLTTTAAWKTGVLAGIADPVTFGYDISSLGLGDADELRLVVDTVSSGANLSTAANNGIAVIGGSDDNHWDTSDPDLSFNLAVYDGGLDITTAFLDVYTIDLTGVGMRWGDNATVTFAGQDIAWVADRVEAVSLSNGQTTETTFSASRTGSVSVNQIQQLKFAFTPVSTGTIFYFR